MKKIVIIPDSFKGSASSMEVCNLIENGVLRVFKDSVVVKKIPVADGGEGTVESVIFAAGGNIVKVKAHCPMGNIIDSFYGKISDKKAVIEMAASSGLPLVPQDKRNPLIANTYGVGELLLHAIDNGAKDILIGIGGSATNDCGIGFANAIGYKFLDDSGKEIECLPSNMINIKKIDTSKVDKRIFDCNISVACDVSNPLYGDNGATAIYGPQKGVTKNMFELLDNGLENVADIVKRDLGKDIASLAGSGAAGGLGFALMAFANANLKSGINAILDIVNFEEEIQNASLIITGEGAIDGQTKHGKVPMGVAERARKYNIPVIAIVGDIRDGADSVYDLGISAIMPALRRAMPLDEAIKNSHYLIEDAAFRAIKFISINI